MLVLKLDLAADVHISVRLGTVQHGPLHLVLPISSQRLRPLADALGGSLLPYRDGGTRYRAQVHIALRCSGSGSI